MWRWIILGVIVLAVVIFGFSLVDVAAPGEVEARTVLLAPSSDTSGFARAIGEWEWEFPRDYGAHPEFQTEWWYYTGNLEGEDGRRFGYQFTIFRRAITPESTITGESSAWRSDQLYMAHFTVTDVAGSGFYHEERFSRAGAGLAGAEIDPVYHVWLENWQVIALDSDAHTMRITAAQANNPVSVDFTLEQLKPPALQGINGLSPKSPETGFEGNASWYYSLSRLATTGTITIGDQTYTVTGSSWKDHEFSTSALDETALGWDWFGLHFDDNREVMIGYIRSADGSRYSYGGGLLINPDGSTTPLGDNFTIESLGTWVSPHTGGEYPSGWNITIDIPANGSYPAETINFTVTPMLQDQELHGSGIVYWEGASRITGDVTGYGYVELTGYVDALTGRL